MKILKTVGLLGALALGALSPVVSAADYMHVEVPFAFVVAGQQFGAGEYVISQNESGLILVQGGGKGAMVISTPAAPASVSGGSTLRFTNSQEQLHLTTVTQEGVESRSIPMHAVEQRTVTMSSR